MRGILLYSTELHAFGCLLVKFFLAGYGSEFGPLVSPGYSPPTHWLGDMAYTV